MAFCSIESQAPSLFKKVGIGSHLALIDRAWAAELGPLASVTQIVAIERGALIVETSAAAVIQELSLRRKELIRRINRYFPEPFLKTVTIRMAHD